MSNIQMSLLDRDFALARDKYKEHMSQDLDLASEKAQSYLGRLLKGLETAVQNTLGKVTSASHQAESGIASLSTVGRHKCVGYLGL